MTRTRGWSLTSELRLPRCAFANGAGHEQDKLAAKTVKRGINHHGHDFIDQRQFAHPTRATTPSPSNSCDTAFPRPQQSASSRTPTQPNRILTQPTFSHMSGRIWTPPDCNRFWRATVQGHNCSRCCDRAPGSFGRNRQSAHPLRSALPAALPSAREPGG